MNRNESRTRKVAETMAHMTRRTPHDSGQGKDPFNRNENQGVVRHDGNWKDNLNNQRQRAEDRRATVLETI